MAASQNGVDAVSDQDGVLEGTTQADLLRGGAGDDVLNGYEGDDTLQGGDGNDTLFGDAGHNVLEGGRGDDSLVGGVDGDLYLFNLGDGNDVISDNALDKRNEADANPAYRDELRFGAGISPQDIELLHVGNDLVLQHGNGEDSVTIQNWFVDKRYWVEQIRFADGTLWTIDDLAQRVIVQTGTDRKETMSGWMGKDHLIGLAGNDTLNGREGDDWLEGGAGDDTLVGSFARDLYLFNVGDGNDLIIDKAGPSNATAKDVDFRDELRFGPDIQEADIQVVHVGNDLVFQHVNGKDSVTVKDWFTSDFSATNQIERITFASTGAEWGIADLEKRVLKREGTAGNDTLEGGIGNDTLNGGEGNDTYRFGRGDGVDLVQDSGGQDALEFDKGVNADQLWFRRQNNSLEVSVIGGGDKVVVDNWFGSAANQLETIRSGDGKALAASQVQALVTAMAAFNPPAAGQMTLPADYQAGLQTVMASSWK